MYFLLKQVFVPQLLIDCCFPLTTLQPSSRATRKKIMIVFEQIQLPISARVRRRAKGSRVHRIYFTSANHRQRQQRPWRVNYWRTICDVGWVDSDDNWVGSGAAGGSAARESALGRSIDWSATEIRVAPQAMGWLQWLHGGGEGIVKESVGRGSLGRLSAGWGLGSSAGERHGCDVFCGVESGEREKRREALSRLIEPFEFV